MRTEMNPLMFDPYANRNDEIWAKVRSNFRSEMTCRLQCPIPFEYVSWGTSKKFSPRTTRVAGAGNLECLLPSRLQRFNSNNLLLMWNFRVRRDSWNFILSTNWYYPFPAICGFAVFADSVLCLTLSPEHPQIRCINFELPVVTYLYNLG
jgi:hypothetical protein